MKIKTSLDPKILAMYIGSDCIADGNRFTLKGVVIGESGTEAFTGNGREAWWVENCDFKLLLRPLCNMTLEEGAYCLRETFFNHVDYPLTDFKIDLVGSNNPRISINNDWFNQNLTFGNKTGSVWSIDTNAANVKIPAKIFQYLISRGFDLFGLIEAGHAIKM